MRSSADGGGGKTVGEIKDFNWYRGKEDTEKIEGYY